MDRINDVVQSIRNLYNLVQKTTNDQLKFIMKNESATVAGNFDILLEEGVETGSIIITTPAAFTGTTGTIDLYGSNDGVNFAVVYQDDNVTPMSFTLATGANTYSWQIKRTLYKHYRIVYTVGDASAGTILATFIGKK